MPGIDDRHDEAAAAQGQNWSGRAVAPSDFGSLVDSITFDGHLAALLACVCEKALEYEPPLHADPGQVPHPGVQAAIRAFAASKREEGQAMATDTRQHPDYADPISEEPETLPLSLAGKWVAWSSDGMRIVAAAETSIEAEQLAIDSGEPEPILERHPGRYRL